MRKIEKIVGTPFTQRKTEHDVCETAEETVAAFRRMEEWGKDPWADERRTVEVARAILKNEIASKPDGYRFKERDDTGWYLQRLIKLGTLVQHHIDQGSAAWAAHEAALFGETQCELRMKLAKEREWTTGKKIHEGGDAARNRPQADRVVAVDALASGPDPISKRQAFKVVAEREGVTAKAIETDYYKAKKRSS